MTSPDGTGRAGLRGRLFSALTGNRGDVSGRGGNLMSMLLAIGGASTKTRSGIDLTKAAASLGVSRRTAERWVAAEVTGTGQRPSPARAKAIATKARQAASTQAGRRTALGPVRAEITARGARLTLRGVQGPKAAGKDYMRLRTTQSDLDPEAAQAMLAAYERGGEKAFLGWATGHWDEQYVADWKFESIDEIGVDPSPPGR